jgi:hypothetical protein
MNDVADHEAHAQVVYRGLGFAEAKDVTAGVVIELTDNTKRLRLKPEFAMKVESFQLLDCPIELCARTG